MTIESTERLSGPTVGVRLPPDVIRVLRERARREHRTLAAEVRRLVLEDLERTELRSAGVSSR